MPTLNPKITDAGIALFPNPMLPGFSVTITHIALGTGLYTPTGAETALTAEVVRYPVTGGNKPQPNQIQINALLTNEDPDGNSANGQWIGEIGFYAGDTLFAIWSRPAVALFFKAENFDVSLAYAIDVSMLPTDSVTVVVDPSIASMQAVVQEHELEPNPHPQYLRVVQRDAANGVAPLGADGLVPLANLPPAIASDAELAAALAGHVNQGLNPDPHPQYITSDELNTALQAFAANLTADPAKTYFMSQA